MNFKQICIVIYRDMCCTIRKFYFDLTFNCVSFMFEPSIVRALPCLCQQIIVQPSEIFVY